MSAFLEASAIELRPPPPFAAEVRPPGSKSLTNRALLLAAIAAGRSQLRGCLDSEDTVLMREALGRLGVGIDARDGGRTLVVDGAGGRLHARDVTLECGTAGTVARFLAAVIAASPASVTLDGSPRMRERPMGALIDALRDQGASLVCTGREGHLPLRIEGPEQGLRGGEIRLERPASSQFVSALIFSACLARAPTRIVLAGGTPARPYVDMTIRSVGELGGRARWTDADTIEVTPAPLRGLELAIEPDASSATYLLALAAIHDSRMRIPDLGRQSAQGDARFADVLARMGARVEQGDAFTSCEGTGALAGVDVDLSDMPDTALTVAVTALHARGTTSIRGVAVLRHHESDRLAAAATELRKLGAEVTETDDGLTIVPPPAGIRPGVAIDTYDDHRVAMAFSLAGRVTVRDPGCVAKTFPRYFNELDKLGMVQRAS